MNDFLRELKTASEMLDKATAALLRANSAICRKHGVSGEKKWLTYIDGEDAGRLLTYNQLLLEAERWINIRIDIEKEAEGENLENDD